jgi:hypothetical protein
MNAEWGKMLIGVYPRSSAAQRGLAKQFDAKTSGCVA